MTSKTSLLNMLIFVVFFTSNTIHSMEESDKNKYYLEPNTFFNETIPNELLFLIFYSKIDDIITTNNASQGKEEFETFLSALRLTRKKFHSWTN